MYTCDNLCIPYLEDILVYSETFDKHLQDVRSSLASTTGTWDKVKKHQGASSSNMELDTSVGLFSAMASLQIQGTQQPYTI